MDINLNDSVKIGLKPVGVVKSAIKQPILHAGETDLELKERMVKIREHQREIADNMSELIIDSELAGILDGIEDFSHVLVLYWPHLIDPERRSLIKVHPMGRKDLPMRGIFATCSPARPNPILVSAVELLERKDNILKVRGLEAVDGSPIIDIKPYSKHYYRVENPSSPQWMEQIHREIEENADSGDKCGQRFEQGLSNKESADKILNSEEFKRCVAFHGHVCPGLSMGYRMAKAGMAWLKENRAEDEELVAIVETDACSADAIQVLTGCTFGKGNFFHKDHGKMAATFFSRKTGQGVRVSLKPESFKPDEEHMSLIKKFLSGEADDSEKERFHKLHLKRSRDVLGKPDNELLICSPVQEEAPTKAVIEPSEICPLCGEPTMPSKMEKIKDKKICRGCA